MPRGATIVVENNFSKGLITEFTAANFPENAVTDCDNVVFSELGRVTRRNGIDQETSVTPLEMSTLTDLEGAFAEFKWDSVDNLGSTSFVVQQIGPMIYFFQTASALTSAKKDFSVDLRDHKTAVADSVIAENVCSMTYGKGFLFVTHPFCEPLAISYDNEEDDIEVQEIDVQIRDFERLDDALDIDERPSTLSFKHKYNLLNQGWYVDAVISGSLYPRPVLPTWFAVRGDYPSNADIWWVYKNSLGQAGFSPQVFFDGETGGYSSSPSIFTLGNTPAPNGHYIYSAWIQDRSAVSGVSNIPVESSGNARPACSVFYAGRIFYAGVSANRYADKVYFSQIIESDDQFGKCYQLNDPTSETSFDLLDSDGGVISLPKISKIISMQVLGDSLLIIGTNGTFAIRGTTDGPFKATDYTVEFVSEVGGVSASSVINVDNSLIWWNYDALYALTKDQSGFAYQVENISKQTIQSVIDDVPADNKRYIKGAYNKRTRKVQWLYSDEDSDPFRYNRILELNVVSKAFYTHTVDNPSGNDLSIVGIISVTGEAQSLTLEDVVDSSDVDVTTDGTTKVQVNVLSSTPNTETFKYALRIYPTNGSVKFAYGNQTTTYTDWDQYTSTSYRSFFISGYRVRGEFLRPFNSTPIAVVLDKVSDAEVIMKGIFDYGFRTTMPQYLYGPMRAVDTARGWNRGDYYIRRIKMRGKGKSLQLEFESDGDNPFSIVGWSTFDTGGQQP